MAETGRLTGLELWVKLKDDGGLTLSKQPEQGVSYDDALLAELREQLFPGEAGAFEALLASHGTSPEHLLKAFFRAIGPFARMMSEILRMFEQATATTGDKNLRLSVDLEKVGDAGIEFDLRSFAEQVRTIKTVQGVVNVRQWTGLAMGKVGQIFDPPGDWLERPPHTGLEEIDAWIRASREADFAFDQLPELPSSKQPDVDATMAALYEDMNDFLATCRQVFGRYGHVRDLDSYETPRRWPFELLRSSAADMWPRRSLENIGFLAQALLREPSDADALGKAIQLDRFLRSLPTEPAKVSIAIEALETFLSLPIWKERHALYAVWVAAAITNDLSGCAVTFCAENGKFSFPFKAHRIAWIVLPAAAETLELWIEIRSGLRKPRSKKRKDSIQPDYRILRSSTGSPVLIIECKQYKQSNREEFEAALEDYARGTGAYVLLCNYGPVGGAVGATVDPKHADRTKAIGHVHPDGEGRPQFTQALLAELGRQIGLLPGARWQIRDARVTLSWNRQHIDLDLYVIAASSAYLSYRTPSGIEGACFSGDDLGTGTPPFKEVVELAVSAEEDRYSVLVRLHSGEGSIADANGAVVIQLDKEPSATFRYRPPAGSRLWHVCDLVKGARRPNEGTADPASLMPASC